MRPTLESLVADSDTRMIAASLRQLADMLVQNPLTHDLMWRLVPRESGLAPLSRQAVIDSLRETCEQAERDAAIAESVQWARQQEGLADDALEDQELRG